MMGLTVILVYVPAHIWVIGNEMTDKFPLDATQRENVKISIPYSKMNIKTLIKHKVRGMRQKQWEEERAGRWFYKIEKRSTGRSRKEETITRLRLGHAELNSTLFKIGKHPTGNCDFCQQQETVDHVISHCKRHEVERRELIQGLKELKMRPDVYNILRRPMDKCYKLLIHFRKRTNLILRV